jgi:hypothetical protein
MIYKMQKALYQHHTTTATTTVNHRPSTPLSTPSSPFSTITSTLPHSSTLMSYSYSYSYSNQHYSSGSARTSAGDPSLPECGLCAECGVQLSARQLGEEGMIRHWKSCIPNVNYKVERAHRIRDQKAMEAMEAMESHMSCSLATLPPLVYYGVRSAGQLLGPSGSLAAGAPARTFDERSTSIRTPVSWRH